MKNLFKTVLIAILVFSSLKASAAILTDREVKSCIAKQVVQNCHKYTDASIDAEVVALPFKELQLPEGHVSFVVKPSADKFLARDLEKVTVYVNGRAFTTFNAPVVIKAYESVLVASTFISRESTINPNNTTIKKVEISNILEYPLRPDSLKKEIVAKKGFREGEVIDKRFIKLRPDVLRNSTVMTVFCSSNLEISIDAVALSDGVIGDNVCVMNKNYNKVYTGKIIGENKVLVKI